MTTAFLTLVIAVAVMVQAITGSGFGVIAVPGMLLAAPELVPGPLLVLTVVVMGGETWRGRRSLHLLTMGWPFLGYAAGAVMALVTLPFLPGKAVALVVALLLLAGVLSALCGWHPEVTAGHLFAAGVVSGLAGLWAGLPGPPMVIAYREKDSARLRANLAAYFGTTSVASLLVLAAAGHFGPDDLSAALPWLPVCALAALASAVLLRYIEDDWMRPMTLGVSLLAAVALLTRTAS